MTARSLARADRTATIEALRERFGERIATGEAVRAQHAHTLTWLGCEPPDAVAFARTTQEVQDIVRLCAQHRCPVIPFGTGTSLEGHVNAPYGGIAIDLRDMNRVLAVHAADFDCVVEPGVTRKALNSHLRDQGLFFPLDPGADASLGGMAATRASGTNAVRYGTMKDAVVALKAVTADGCVMSTARRARKSAAGYDLTRLLVGSEGTLAVITELTLRLHGIPETIAAGICAFPSVAAACEAAIATVQSGIAVARIELLDALQVRACNAYSHLALPETPMLCVEFHGTQASVAEDARLFGEIAAQAGGDAFRWETRAEERARLWQARHDAYWAAQALRPGMRPLVSDVCVPLSRLAECVTATQRDITEAGLLAPILGHVGDGNFHVMLFVDEADAAERLRVEAFLDALVARALAMDGTCTGEHGVGQGKRKHLGTELGREAVSAMAAIKHALDPDNIMNPGKIFQM